MGDLELGCRSVSDGSLLFLLHLIAKMRPAAQGGSRIAIVLNGSPLFTGGAGSGEKAKSGAMCSKMTCSKLLSPCSTDMFYNTGISTYIWVLSKSQTTCTPRTCATHRCE
jgi:type I restriction enzyme M protein